MADALPRPIRLRLEQALAHWRHWRPAPGREPVAVARLAGGCSNVTVKVAAGGEQWAVRIDGVPPARLGLSRAAEWHIMELAHARGLCPRPVYHNPALGCLVTAFVDGDGAASGGLTNSGGTASGNSIGDSTAGGSTGNSAAGGSTSNSANGKQPAAVDDIPALATLLRNIHALPAAAWELDPLQRARCYLRASGGGTLPLALVDACRALSANKKADAPPLTLCHNDLLRGNRLAGGAGLLALDWEYAAMGDPLFDLAAIIEGDNLTPTQADTLLEHWLHGTAGTAPSSTALNAQRHRLNLQRMVYRELSTLWESAIEHGR